MTRAEAATVAAVVSKVEEAMDRLRETAAELRAGRIHPSHAANRIEKIADAITRSKQGE